NQSKYIQYIKEVKNYKKIIEHIKQKQQDIATRLSKSIPYIANMLRLLQLPKEFTGMVKDGKLSGAHGRTLLAIKDKQKIKKIAHQASREAWSVRSLEQYVNTCN